MSKEQNDEGTREQQHGALVPREQLRMIRGLKTERLLLS